MPNNAFKDKFSNYGFAERSQRLMVNAIHPSTLYMYKYHNGRLFKFLFTPKYFLTYLNPKNISNYRIFLNSIQRSKTVSRTKYWLGLTLSTLVRTRICVFSEICQRGAFISFPSKMKIPAYSEYLKTMQSIGQKVVSGIE